MILHSIGDRIVPIEVGRYMAARIPNAKFVEVDSIDHLPYFDRADDFILHIQKFLTGHQTLH